jgi:hypothetical protein
MVQRPAPDNLIGNFDRRMTKEDHQLTVSLMGSGSSKGSNGSKGDKVIVAKVPAVPKSNKNGKGSRSAIEEKRGEGSSVSKGGKVTVVKVPAVSRCNKGGNKSSGSKGSKSAKDCQYYDDRQKAFNMIDEANELEDIRLKSFLIKWAVDEFEAKWNPH